MAHEFGIMSHYDIERTAEAISGDRQLNEIGPSGFLALMRSLMDGYTHTSVESAADIAGDLTEPIPRVPKVRPPLIRRIVTAITSVQLHRPPR